MKLMLKYLRPQYALMFLGLSIKVSGTVIELALPFILSHILKNVVGSLSVALVIAWGGAMIFCAAAACVLNVTANRIAEKVTKSFARRLRKDLFDKTIRLSAAQTDYFTIASLESRITTDTYNVRRFSGVMQRMGVRAPILLIGGTAITLIMDRYLALAMIAALPFIFVTVYYISRKGVPLYTRVQKSVDNMIRVVREDVMGIRVIKALSKGDYEHRRYDSVNKLLCVDEKHAGVTMGMVNPVMTMFMNFGIVAVVALAAFRVNIGRSDPETVIAFMQYFTLISMAMLSVTRIFVMYTKAAASARRIAEVLYAEEDLTVKPESKYPAVSTDSHIVFKDVSFSYKGKKDNLSHIDLDIAKGGSLGIIGATGSGKSTLIKLLMRFYDVSSGGIYIGGRDIRTIPKEELYKMFGSAMQNDFLYADSIEENIKFGRNLSHDEIVSAAKIAQADDFISAIPEGYSYMLAVKGQNLSGGQKQRLLISRAVAAHPEILILDDSSSALDYKTDAALRRALAENMKGSTVITVAQRVSSVKNCDKILLLSDGVISGCGTHEELLESCPEYKEISESQMGGDFVE